MATACLTLRAAENEFWATKDSASWTHDEKRLLLEQSPWAREGFVRMESAKNRQTTPGYGNSGRPGGDLPNMRPGGAHSVPIGEKLPPPPKPDSGEPLQFRVLTRWESAKPVRLAGGLEVTDSVAQFYVIWLRGMPLMPAPKAKPGEVPPNPNESILQAIKQGSRLERKDKPVIPCAHLFAGSGETATEVLLFFPRAAAPITVADKLVTLESRFVPFQLSVKFPLKEMMYAGELAV